jgi:hypothetical protein
MQQLTGDDKYAAGKSDNWLKRASVGIDRAIESTGIPETTGAAGRSFGELVGNPEMGESVGRSMGRLAVNMAPMFIPGVGLPATAARLGGMGLLAGADTYTQTDSPAAGVLSGLTVAALPKVANLAEQAVLKRFLPNAGVAAVEGVNSRLVQGSIATNPAFLTGLSDDAGAIAVKQLFPTSLGQGLAAQTGGQTAAALLMEASAVGQAGIDPNSEYEFSPSGTFINLTLGQLPFAALYATKGGRAAFGGDAAKKQADGLQQQINITETHLQIRNALDAAKREQTVPDVKRTPEQEAAWMAYREETQKELGRLREEQIKIINDPNLGPDAKAAALEPLVAADAAASAKMEGPQRGNIFGENPDLSGHIGVVGQNLPHRQGDKVRKIFISDDPSNPEEFRGRTIYYSKGTKEPAPKDIEAAPGYQTFGIPADRRWRTDVTPNLPKNLGPEDALAWTAAQAKLRAKVDQKTNPLEFAEQQKALDLEHWSEQSRLLEEAAIEFDNAKTDAELTVAAAKLRLVQEANGFPITDDIKLAKRKRELELVGVKANELTIKAARAEANRTRKQLAAAQKIETRRSEISQAEQFYADQTELAKTDPDVADEVQGLDKLHALLEGNSGKWAQQLASGDAYRLYKDWVDGGRKTSFSVFARNTLDKATSGEGLMKLKSRTNDLAKELDDSPEMAPVSDYVVETLVSVLNDPTATEKYNTWDRRAETTLTNQKMMFVALGDAHAFGPDGRERAMEIFMDREGLNEIEAREEVESFFRSPHVREWLKVLGSELVKPAQQLPSPSPKTAAGGGFLWDFTGWNPETRAFGNKSLASLGAKDGNLLVSRFKNVAGDPTLSNAIIELARNTFPDVFSMVNGQEQVNVPVLMSKLDKVMEVRVYGQEGKVSEAKAELDKMTHEWYDNLPAKAARHVQFYVAPDRNGVVDFTSAESQRVKAVAIEAGAKVEDIDRYAQLKEKVKSEPLDTSPRATSYYKSISPFDTEKHPVVRVDVVLPEKKINARLTAVEKARAKLKEEADQIKADFGGQMPYVSGLPLGWFVKDAEGNPVRLGEKHDARLDQFSEKQAKLRKLDDLDENFDADPISRGVLWPQDNLHENLPNTLGWAMVQFVPGADGQTVMFVGEQQSRWGQEQRKTLDGAKVEEIRGGKFVAKNSFGVKIQDKSFATKEEAQAVVDSYRKEMTTRQGHPLLPLQHVLVLKAAIAEAQKRGVTKMVVSDGETAMITEKHDDIINAARKDIVKANTPASDAENERFYLQGQLTREEFDARKGEQQEKAVQRNFTGLESKYGSSGAKFAIQDGVIVMTKEPFVGGMDIHYNITLQSAMRSLTGDGGTKVDLGVHKNAREKPYAGEADLDGLLADGDIDQATYDRLREEEKLGKPIGSPVFSEIDPTTGQRVPKKLVTGTVYDLTAAQARITEQGGSTLTNPSRMLGEPFVPESPEGKKIVSDLQPELGAVGLLNWMSKQSENGAALAADLAKFPNLLSIINVRLMEMPGEGRTWSATNGRVQIDLNPALFWGDMNAHAEKVAGHELLHGLTKQEIARPENANIKAEFDDVRQRLAAQLPTHLRSLYNEAIRTKWLDRYAKDDASATIDQLGKTFPEQEIVYGLLNVDEMISQNFSSESFRNFARSKKSKDGQTFYSRFTNLVKSLFGLSARGSTAFDEIMSISDRLMQRGEWIADFQNYAERHFEGQGVDPLLARQYTQRALNLVVNESYGTNVKSLFQALDIPGFVKSVEVLNAEKRLNLLLQDKASDEYGSLLTGMQEHGLQPNRNGLDEFAQMVLRGEETADAFDVLPPEANAYVWAKISDMKQVLDVVAAATKEKVSPLVNISQPQNLRGPVRDAVRAAKRVLKAQAFHEESARELIGLQGIDPMGYAESMADVEGLPSPSPKSEMMGYVEDAKDATKSFGSWIKTTLQPIAQRMAEMPETKEVFARGWQIAENARRFVSDTLTPMGRDISDPTNTEVTKESLNKSLKVLQNPRLEAIAQKYIWLNQVEGKKNKSTTILPESHPEIQKILVGVSAADRSAINDVIGKLSYSTQATNAKQLEYMRQVAAVRAAIIVNADNGLSTGQNIKVTGEMLQSILDLNDPAKQAIAGQKLNALQGKFSDPQAYIETVKFLEAEAGKYKLWEDLFKANPAYANAQRQGRYLIHYTDKSGKMQLGQAMSKAAGRLWLENRGFKLDRFESNWKTGEDSFPAIGTDAEGLLQRYRELEESQIAILRNRGFGEEQVAALRASSPTAQLATEAAYRGGISSDLVLARNLGKGAENLPWVENHFTWVQRTANYWTRQLFAAQMDTHILEKQFAERPELRQEFKTHKDNMLQKDPELAQKVTRFARTWFMGFNAASALVNMAQPFTTHVAELTSLTGKPLDSYRRVLNALREIAGERGGKEWATPEHKWLHAEMAKDGVLDLSMYDDNAATQESIHTRYKEVIEGSQPQTLGQKLGKAAGHYSTAAFWMFRQGERINATAATFASFDLFREQGLSRDEAYAKAKEFNARTNYSGGPAQRSLGAFSSRSGFGRGTAMLATSLQSYVLGTTFQLARYLQAGLFRPQGLTPGEVYAARKAGVQMLATQLGAAGVLGLPFVSGAIALLDKSFPDLELNRNLRELMGQIFGEDEKNGNTLSDMAMTGLPSMLGWDMQSRLSMGNTVPGVSEINGFQPEMLLGPAANLVTNFIRGGKGFITGDMNVAAKGLLPGYAKSLIEAGKQTLGQPVEDYRDRPLFTPTPGEVLGQSIGFKSKRLSDTNAADRMLRASEDVAQRKNHQQSTQLAERALAGEFGTVRQTLLARGQSEQGYDPVGGARQVAQAAEALTFPRDLRREGTQQLSSSRNKLLSSFGITPGSVSEVDRLRFRSQIEARLGVPKAAGEKSELEQAQLMDQLAVKNPGLSRLELRQLALQIRRPNFERPTLGEPRELQ